MYGRGMENWRAAQTQLYVIDSIKKYLINVHVSSEGILFFFYRNRHDQFPSVCPCLYSGDIHLPRVLQVSLYSYIIVSHYSYNFK